MTSHIEFSREHFSTLQARNVSVTGGMHVLIVLVKVGLVVGAIITLITFVFFGFIGKVCVVMNLGKKCIYIT